MREKFHKEKENILNFQTLRKLGEKLSDLISWEASSSEWEGVLYKGLVLERSIFPCYQSSGFDDYM